MDFLTNPFATALLFLYQLLGQNMMLTIVVFTVIIRLLIFPLTYQQLKSSKAMQELSPKLKELQEKLKGDREKLAAAQMELYKTHGVNPLAGCLPLVVQFPILIGLYGAISRALATSPLQVLDLSHRLIAPGLAHLIPLQNTFGPWNLGLPDTLFILPIIVVATTWLQQKLLMPVNANADPKDPSVAVSRQMTVMMPLMIGFFSLQVPSGMAVYWIVGNLFGIGQYTAMGRANFRNLFGRPAPAVVTNAVSKAKAQINGGSSRPAINVPTLRKTDAANSSNGSTSTSQSNSVTPAKPKAKAKARAK